MPRKRVKTETQEMQPEDSWDAVYEQSQLADITQQLLKFADYFKNATVHIHHHERSIATLPPAITDKYPHLRTRGRDLR